MIEFKSLCDHEPGQLFSLLVQSYSDYFEHEPDCRQAWLPGWEQYDHDVFAHPETIGACGFVTWLDSQAIGFASWDPRLFPTIGIIGHNCILPAFRGSSFGKRQIIEILRIFSAAGVQVVRVTTGEHPFFLPAQGMYQSCGFKEVNRHFSIPCSRYRAIDYELSLKTRPAGSPLLIDPINFVRVPH
jgi:GNAT superfamily N-acetyltransferase